MRETRPVRRHARAEADPRVAAYGDVDELNAWLGLRARAACPTATSPRMLEQIQRDLFALGARLADPAHRIAERVTKAAVIAGGHRAARRLDRHARSELPPLRRFILAGGSPAAPRCTWRGRLPPRRARDGRRSATEPSSRSCCIYVNRLSDLLFVMARAVNHRAGVAGNRVVSVTRRRRRDV